MSLVVLTGAGISAESGVPTFRGAAGIWRNMRPEDLATPAAFIRDPGLVWDFYAWRRDLVSRCEPNEAHVLLAEIETAGHEITIFTQNVDGLHQRAGSHNVVELHGSLWKLKCTICIHKWETTANPFPNMPPTCPQCGALARPDVIWFGESLNSKLLQHANDSVQQADTLLVIGTSALVYPVAGLPRIARRARVKIIEINPQDTPVSNLADEIFREPATIGLKLWWLGWQKIN